MKSTITLKLVDHRIFVYQLLEISPKIPVKSHAAAIPSNLLLHIHGLSQPVLQRAAAGNLIITGW